MSVLMLTGATVASVVAIGGALWSHKRTMEERRGKVEARIGRFEEVYDAVVNMPQGFLSDRLYGVVLNELLLEADKIIEESGDTNLMSYATRVEALIGAWKSQYLAFVRRPMPVHEHMSKQDVRTIHHWLGQLETLLDQVDPMVVDPDTVNQLKSQIEQARWRTVSAFHDRRKDERRIPEPVPSTLPSLAVNT